MTTYIISGKAGSGKSLLAKRIAMSYPTYEYMCPFVNVYDGTFTPWTSQIDCVVVEALSKYDFSLNGHLKESIESGIIPGIDEGCALVLVFRNEVPLELVGLKDVIYVHTETTDDTLEIE